MPDQKDSGPVHRTHDEKSDAPARRILWPDYAKGIGIFWVVVGHTLRGLEGSGIIKDDATFLFIDHWIYSFHMPLFFFVSGVFAVQSVRKPWFAFAVGKFKTIAYPYFVWSIIQFAILLPLSSYANHPTDISELFKMVYHPTRQFWFLYVLFLIFMIYGILSKMKLGGPSFFLICLIYFCLPKFTTLGSWGVPYIIREYILYFAAGVWINDRIHPLLSCAKQGRLFIGIFISYGFLSFCVYRGYEEEPFAALLIAMAGIIGTLSTAELLGRHRLFRFIRGWGELSLQIYVAHTIASAGFRILLQKLFHWDHIGIHIVGGVAVGMYFPIFLDFMCRYVKFPYLFTLKSRVTGFDTSTQPLYNESNR